MAERSPLLEVRDLSKRFVATRGLRRKVSRVVQAVDLVSFELQRGETLSLVGESGSGKTTMGRCIVRAIEPSSGTVLYRSGDGEVDLTTADQTTLRQIRQEIRMVFQDPHSSLNPRMTLLQLVGEPLLIHRRIAGRAELRERVADLLQLVQLDPTLMDRHPHAFSGGQRQRIAIARALALDPKIVIADEPVSALDVSVQAQILNLMKNLQADRDLTYLFIAHDLAVVRYQSDRIAVMYLGRIIEVSTRDEVFANPLHPYTELLLASSPVPDPRARRRRTHLKGEVPDPGHRPTGCGFHPRCPYAQDICRTEVPELLDTTSDGISHSVACHFSAELSLAGLGQPRADTHETEGERDKQ